MNSLPQKIVCTELMKCKLDSCSDSTFYTFLGMCCRLITLFALIFTGWNPSSFKSTRGERSEFGGQRPEDFMDEEVLVLLLYPWCNQLKSEPCVECYIVQLNLHRH